MFHGSVQKPYRRAAPGLATRFFGCRFKHRAPQNLGVFRWTALVELDRDNILLGASRLVANRSKGIYADGRTSRDPTIIQRHAALADGDFQSFLRGSRLENVRFAEESGDGIEKWHIAAEDVNVAGTFVQCPRRDGDTRAGGS